MIRVKIPGRPLNLTPYRVTVVLIVVIAIGRAIIQVEVVGVVIIVTSARPPVPVVANIVLRPRVEVPGGH